MAVTITLPNAAQYYRGTYNVAGITFTDGVATVDSLTPKQAAVLALLQVQTATPAAIAAATMATAGDLAAVAAMLEPLTVGQATLPRQFASQSVTLNTGQLRLAWFTARRTETVANVRVLSGGTASAATPTLQRLGLYTVNTDGSLTLAASTTNDTATLLRTANTAYTKPLSTPVSLVAGSRYALGLLAVSTSALATVTGLAAAGAATEALLDPPLNAISTATLTDLPATLAMSALSATTNRPYLVVTP